LTIGDRIDSRKVYKGGYMNTCNEAEPAPVEPAAPAPEETAEEAANRLVSTPTWVGQDPKIVTGMIEHGEIDKITGN
jgi:hypothetical protein